MLAFLRGQEPPVACKSIISWYSGQIDLFGLMSCWRSIISVFVLIPWKVLVFNRCCWEPSGETKNVHSSKNCAPALIRSPFSHIVSWLSKLHVAMVREKTSRVEFPFDNAAFASERLRTSPQILWIFSTRLHSRRAVEDLVCNCDCCC